jgi:nuclear receptor-binding protein
LHCCEPPIIHGNLTTDTIFIQHNGLIKIGSVAPDAIYNHVKTYKAEAKNLHYVAPEYGDSAGMTTAVDIYAFGICALEMAALEIPANGDAVHTVGEDLIQKVLESVEDHLQKDFITRCLEKDPSRRPTARELLFHPVLFEVHSLKLLAAHAYIKSNKGVTDDISSLTYFDNSKIIAEIATRCQKANLKNQTVGGSEILELQKFLIDVRNGVYPLTAFTSVPPLASQGSRARAATPEQEVSVKTETPEPVEAEGRLVIRHSCQIHSVDNTPSLQMTLLLRMDDQMNRQLTCEFSLDETPKSLADELVQHGFINIADSDKIAACINETIHQQIHSVASAS